ncbi:PREDICTED: transcription initiation factor TFIID subunit 7-like isoform X1 [Myotis brandtii]|uniref:transcription initiation factor TFIID subunit 7-like isoform X1 n=1 Tax=Myotis brandtii TaxID=109478 RepID=UPI0007044186|nr:PREDICTED: transcription initiation factor TFIID subunit 7-like isoform X1 [Myotis brandtii]
MSKHQHEPPYEIENQFIWRLPPEHAATVREIIRSGSVAMKDKLKIDLSSDGRHAAVEVKDVSLTAKVVDLPCVIGSLKTLDNKMFYKTADISQMLVCTADGGLHSSPEEAVTSTDLKVIKKKEKGRRKKYAWKHGITPPLKNVRKKRFRKTRRKCSDSPDSEKEVKRLLCSDAEAVSVRWEVIAEGETKEIESKGSVPSFEMSPGTSGYKRGDSSPVVEIRKHIHYMEKKIQEIQCRAQRQKNLIKKVENLTLKNHLYSVLEQLELQKKQKNEQIISLQEKLKFFLEK